MKEENGTDETLFRNNILMIINPMGGAGESAKYFVPRKPF